MMNSKNIRYSLNIPPIDDSSKKIKNENLQCPIIIVAKGTYMNIPEYIINYHALFKNSNSENKEKFESKKRNIKADLYYLLYILLLLPEEKNKTCVPQKSKQ